MKRTFLALVAILALAACGGGEDVEPAASADAPAEAAPSSDAPPAVDPTPPAVPAAPDGAETEQRTGGEMGSYESCIAQVRDLPRESQARAAIERACGNLPDAPR